MKKADIETRYMHGREYPTVNIKWYGDGWVRYWRDACADHGIDPDAYDPEELMTDDERYLAWTWVAEDQFRDAAADIRNLYQSEMGMRVDVWQDGRSGGWLIVDNLPDVETWDAIMVSRWARAVKIVRSYLEDCDYQYAWRLAAMLADRQDDWDGSVTASRVLSR